MITQYTDLAYRPDPTTGKGQQVYNPKTGKAYGSPGQLAGDLGVLPNQIDWSKIGSSSAGNLSQGQQPIQTGVKPSENESVSSIDAMLAGYQEQFKQATEAMKTSSENVSNAPQFSATETLNQQMESSGINQALQQSNSLIAEANVIREGIAKLEDAKNQEILSMREKGGVSQTTMNARENIAEMKWNSRISAESAKLSGYAATIDALNGNITRAQSFITQAVNAATYDQEQNLNRLTQTYEMNKDLFTSLGSQYQNAFNQAIQIRQQELSDAKAEKKSILQLQADAAANYGVVLDLTGMNYEEASKAYAQAVSPIQAQGLAVERAKALSGLNSVPSTIPANATPTDIEQIVLKSKIDQLPAGQQEAAYSAIQSFQNAKDMLSLLDAGVKTGPIGGFFSKLGQKLGTTSEETNKFIAAATSFSANYIKSISGVAVSEQEYKRLLKALPSITNQENVNRDNIEQLLKTIQNKYETQLGIKFSDYPNAIPTPGTTSSATKSYINSLGY